MVNTRIYTVSSPTNGADATRTRLVEATSAAQAIRHVTKGFYNAQVPTNLELVDLMRGGVAVEKAGEEPVITTDTN